MPRRVDSKQPRRASRADGFGLTGGTRIPAGSLRNPNSKAVYAWRAFVSNPDAHGNPDPSTTYELRSDLPLPAKLTLTARADPNHHRAALDGRLTTYTLPVARVPIALYRRPSCGCWRYLTGRKRRRTAHTASSFRSGRPRRYSAEAWEIGACSGDSTAPKGCIDETRAVIDSPTIRIVVRRRH